MVALLCFRLRLLVSLFKSNSRLEAENAALRHPLIVLQRKAHGRIQFTNGDRLFFIQLCRWFPSLLKAVTIIRPETLVRWHRWLLRPCLGTLAMPKNPPRSNTAHPSDNLGKGEDRDQTCSAFSASEL